MGIDWSRPCCSCLLQVSELARKSVIELSNLGIRCSRSSSHNFNSKHPRSNQQKKQSAMTSIVNKRKVSFGEKASVHTIDCVMTKAERNATWYTPSEFKSIKDNIRVACERVKYGKDSGMFHETESIRGLEKLLVDNRGKMVKRKRNILWSTIELQAMTVPSDARVLEIKNTLECYIQKHHKLAADTAENRAQADRRAAQDIYNEVVEVLEISKKQPSSRYSYVPVVHRQRGEANVFNQKSLAAVSA